MQTMWWIRAGLSNPSMSLRTVRDVLQDFPMEEGKGLCINSIRFAKDAFVELIKKFSLLSLQREVRNAMSCAQCDQAISVCVVHVHDEAPMRMRSYRVVGADEVGAGTSLARGAYSKVQNNCVNVAVGDNALVDWFVELQPLLKKDGPSLATAIILAVKSIMDTLSNAQVPGKRPARVLHLLTGDGINTNDNAMKRVCFHFRQASFRKHFDYQCINWKCAAHISNRLVAVAVCGGTVQDAERTDAICCACSRYFKHLLPCYSEEFACNLRKHIHNNLKLTTVASLAEVYASRY